MYYAIVRDVSESMDRCELTHLDREPIDIAEARRQHDAYIAALESCGCEIVRLAEQPELPDSVFVEDTAVITDEFAIMMRPGAEVRRAEVGSVREALSPYRQIAEIHEPGRIDGGDVLRLGRQVFVGQSERSDPAGIEQLARHVIPHGYKLRVVPMQGCLHLKTAVTEVADGVVLLNPEWVRREDFASVDAIEVDSREPFAANVLRIGDKLIYPTAFPHTEERLRSVGLDLVTVDMTELAKAEGAVTCCSLIVGMPTN